MLPFPMISCALIELPAFSDTELLREQRCYEVTLRLWPPRGAQERLPRKILAFRLLQEMAPTTMPSFAFGRARRGTEARRGLSCDVTNVIYVNSYRKIWGHRLIRQKAEGAMGSNTFRR